MWVVLNRFKTRAAALKREVYTLYLAARDPRTPWYAKLFTGCVIAYALSPIDLIPDPIPVIGYLDDLILLPLGIYLAIKMIPDRILAECRIQAESRREALTKNWTAAAIIVMLWIGGTLILLRYLLAVLRMVS
jgi:uncharacterized membrane protein YkvA (DUF1232 family)